MAQVPRQRRLRGPLISILDFERKELVGSEFFRKREISLAPDRTTPDKYYRYNHGGDFVAVLEATGTAEIIFERHDATLSDSLPLQLGATFEVPFTRFFVSHAAQPGMRLILFIGGEAAARVVPRLTATKITRPDGTEVSLAEQATLESVLARLEDLVLFGNDLSATLVSTTTPMAANASYTSPAFNADRYGRIVGSIFADQGGTLRLEFTNDGVNFDARSEMSYSANSRDGFDFPVVGQIARLVFINGAADQSLFRLFAKGRVI